MDTTLPSWTSHGIAYWTLGDGPTLLCVHGGPGTDHSFYRPYLDALARDMRVVYFDLPGHGQSSPPVDYGLEMMARSINNVRETVKVDRVSLVGSSYGGFLSLLYACRHPDAVASLILVDTSASYGFRVESIETAKQRGTALMLGALERLWNGSLESDDEFHSTWHEILPLYFHQLPREEIRRLAERANYSLETRKQILPTLQGYDMRGQLHDIDVPSLIMVGRHDWITGVGQAEELATGLPRGELMVFEESGHYPFIEENGTFLRCVRSWLATHVT